MTRQEKIRLTWLVNIAAVCLGFGIMLPAMRIDPGDGTIRRFIMAFVIGGPSSHSILSSVWALIKTGAAMDILLGIIIFLFSIVFPIMKLGVFYSVLSGGNPDGRFPEFIHKWGRFSMLDVYVVAILVLTIRSLPGGAQIKPSWGLLLFTISVLLSLYVSRRLEA
jgi:uncharacterized paraquat-inducible protein A